MRTDEVRKEIVDITLNIKWKKKEEEERNKYVDHKTHLLVGAKAGSNYIFYSIGRFIDTLCVVSKEKTISHFFFSYFWNIFSSSFIQDVHTIHRKTIFQNEKTIFDFVFHLRSLENRIHTVDGDQWTKNCKHTLPFHRYANTYCECIEVKFHESVKK